MISKLREIGVVNILLALIVIAFIVPPLILNPILIGLLFVFGVFRYLTTKSTFYKSHFNKISISFIAYFLVLLLSLFYSNDLKTGFSYIGKSFSFLVIPLIPLFISKKEVNLLWISKVYILFLCGIFFLLFFIAIVKNFNEGYTFSYIYQRIIGLDTPKDKYIYFNYWYFVYDKFTLPLDMQPIYLGFFTNVGLVFLFFLKKIKQVKFYYVKLIILGLLILLSASRWQILICAINFAIFILFFDDLKPFKKILGITLFALSILIVSFINPVTKTRFIEAFSYKEAFYKTDFGSTSLRLKKWNNAIQSISESPVLGYGVGDGQKVLMNQYKKNKFYLGYYNKFNSHNQYLDTLLYVGLIGFILLCLILFYAYKCAMHKLYLFMITNIFMIGFITESMLDRQWGIIAFPFLLIIFSIYDYETIKN